MISFPFISAFLVTFFIPYINSNGIIKLKGGFIRSVRAFESSLLSVEGAIVGEDNNPCFPVPIETSGKFILKSGTIKARNGISILVHGKKEEKCGSIFGKNIDIQGEILYNQ